MVITLMMFALAPGYRWSCEQEEAERGPVGWQHWRCRLQQKTKEG
jgi:hypothetical protein